MTISKGQSWGELLVPRPGLTIVHDDESLSRLLVADAITGPVGLLGGDVMRTVGGRGDRARFTAGEPIPHLPIDAVRVVADGEHDTMFVAHLVARRSWWSGTVTAAMNAQFLGAWDVAPRSHPNDGKVDIVTAAAELSLQQRWLARKRLRLGTHLPHPLISTTQRCSVSIDLERSTPIWIDGRRWLTARHLDLTVEPNAITVVV